MPSGRSCSSTSVRLVIPISERICRTGRLLCIIFQTGGKRSCQKRNHKHDRKGHQIIGVAKVKGKARYGKEEIKYKHIYNGDSYPPKAIRCDDRNDHTILASEKPSV